VGGIVDLVKQDENGILAQPGDVQSLAEALQAMAKNSNTRERLGNGSRERAKLYDWSKVTARYLALFEELIKTK
jgi:glycosyltransferase involved in cell wall biosynthesis